MKERIIKVEPFDFIDFRTVEISKKIDKHGTAHIVGMISEENAVKYLSNNVDTAKIKTFDSEGNELTIFDGCIQNISVDYEGGISLLTIKLISHTFKMDIVKRIRTFQDKKMTYGEVASIMIEDSSVGSIISPKHNDTSTGAMFVQYRETDWEFSKRMASRIGTFIVPDNEGDGPMLSIGPISKKEQADMKFDKYSMLKDNSEYLVNKEHGIISDYVYYKAGSREAYELCTSTSFNGSDLIVCEILSHLEGEELMHEYTLKPLEGLVCKENFNTEIIGMSLTGNILEIEKDLVKVKIRNDVKQKSHRWFSYATVYSSPDNTGWYFMPEVGDEVQLYFPSELEKKSYVMSSVHLEMREDADVKSIRTKWGKEIVFSPKSIFINNGAGSTITLDDGNGILIDSIKKIEVTAGDNITFDAVGKIKITGDKGVIINQAGNQISVDENIDISAGHVRIR